LVKPLKSEKERAMKNQQREIRREEHEVTSCPLCDGCGKQIKTKTFYKFFWHESGEDAQNDGEFYLGLHSHTHLTCVGKVMAMIFE
jgi:hypothetical protein